MGVREIVRKFLTLIILISVLQLSCKAKISHTQGSRGDAVLPVSVVQKVDPK